MSNGIMLKNVRLSFPSLFRKGTYNGQENNKYEATFLIPKSDKETYEKIMAEIERLKTESKVKVPDNKLCIKDGDEYDYEGYAGHWALKASNEKRPPVFNRDRSIITEDDNIVYAGCYVNAKVDFWVQNNSYGKRVNSNLLGVQFVKDGESFEGAFVASEDDFDAVDEEF